MVNIEEVVDSTNATTKSPPFLGSVSKEENTFFGQIADTLGDYFSELTNSEKELIWETYLKYTDNLEVFCEQVLELVSDISSFEISTSSTKKIAVSFLKNNTSTSTPIRGIEVGNDVFPFKDSFLIKKTEEFAYFAMNPDTEYYGFIYKIPFLCLKAAMNNNNNISSSSPNSLETVVVTKVEPFLTSLFPLFSIPEFKSSYSFSRFRKFFANSNLSDSPSSSSSSERPLSSVSKDEEEKNKYISYYKEYKERLKSLMPFSSSFLKTKTTSASSPSSSLISDLKQNKDDDGDVSSFSSSSSGKNNIVVLDNDDGDTKGMMIIKPFKEENQQHQQRLVDKVLFYFFGDEDREITDLFISSLLFFSLASFFIIFLYFIIRFLFRIKN